MENINHECYVSPEIAKMLKDAGFDWETKSYYVDNNSGVLYGYNNSIVNWNAKNFFMRDCNGSIFVSNGTYIDSITGNYITASFFSAPTLDVAQRWLREVEHLDVIVNRNFPLHEPQYSCKYKYVIIATDGRVEAVDCYFDEYEQSQEAGIQKALEIILKERK